MSGWYRCAVISMITACVPLGTQTGWQQQRSAYAQPYAYGSQRQAAGYAQPSAYGSQQQANPYDDDGDYDDDAGGPSYGDANESDRGQARGGAGGASNWTCVAQGSIGTGTDTGSMSYRNKEWPDTGRTRDEAYQKALQGCNSLMGNAANLGYLSDEKVDGGSCTVVDCRPTGT